MFKDQDFLAHTLANPENLKGDEKEMFAFQSGYASYQGSGILCLEPNQPVANISLVLSAGIHGNETGPIELLNELVMDILSGKVSLGIRLLCIIGNPKAALIAERFCEVNLNRLFGGAWQQQQGYEAQRAEHLEACVNAFFEDEKGRDAKRLHYDLHTAIRDSVHEKFAVHPYVPNGRYQQQQLAFLAACDVEAVLFSHQATTTFSYYTFAHHAAQAFTLELGKVRAFGDNDPANLARLRSCLLQLMVSGELRQEDVDKLKLFQVVTALIKDAQDYRLNITDDVANFTAFRQGFCLAESSLGHYHIEQQDDAIVFPNTKLPIGQRAGLVVRSQLKEYFSIE
ncbi:succinylglutamate desuccinylase [Marinomonas sp. THO17]|uniref:succinylglutamate desuccinylase n=1 Tax=Marinomonas sp. THO17 TaxID=3149048 RepID=UPI00336C03FE